MRFLALFSFYFLVYNSVKGLFSGGSMSMTNAQVVELYSSGKSCAEVARLDECSETSVYNRLVSLGVVLRSRSEANKIFPDSIFVTLYNMGLSTSQVGRVLGVNSSTVTKRLHSLHYPLRSRILAQKIRYTEQEFKKYFMIPHILDQLTELVSSFGII